MRIDPLRNRLGIEGAELRAKRRDLGVEHVGLFGNRLLGLELKEAFAIAHALGEGRVGAFLARKPACVLPIGVDLARDRSYRAVRGKNLESISSERSSSMRKS